ncbi:sporulation related domain protein [Mariprofundus micogutta]|uniref:Sporulation related domain protein n=1 Tax=Mariprofundus micogutta TaxID=1921010 RepID=A0A1L8CK75_9PROT|nr:SPOR domain-containing protein [Mariprofundus micogutta]GAV19317.1 sporulation related domain protein [Mariprofundus micogutta]
MTDHRSDDKDYNLNHFDFSPDEPEQQKADLQENSSAEHEGSAEDRQEPLLSADAGEIEEPVIIARTETDAVESEGNQDNISAPLIPQMEADFPSSQPQNSGSGSTMATAFAVVAMLIAGGAVWLNFNQPEETDQAVKKDQLAPGYNTIINDELIKLRERVAVVELEKDELNQRVSQQNQVLLKMQKYNRTSANEIESLKAEVATLSSKLSKQAQKTAVKRVSKPVAVKPVSQAASAPVKKAAARAGTQYELPAPLESLPAGKKSSAGGWVVNIASVYSESAAKKELARLRGIGIDAEISESMVKGRQLFRIRTAGFASREEALQQKDRLASQHGIKDAWVHKP